MRILFLDDDEMRHDKFGSESVSHDITHVRTVEQAIKAFEKEPFDLICLDHDLGGMHYVPSEDPTTGYHVAAHIAAKGTNAEVIVHSYNVIGAQRMVNKLKDAGIAARHLPFGTWSLHVEH